MVAEWLAIDSERWRSSLVARAERERGREASAEGASERRKVGEQGTRLKRGEDVRRWPKIARSWVRPRRGIVGGRLGTSLQVGLARQREKWARVREDDADKPIPWGSERERARWLAPTGGARLSGTEGAHGWA
jgi:hypothetical protein